ncbi:hypothetical protein GJ496_012027 [Pomphorhynchus laevis]|nr:hypothetical protein GJ496_012027 [Pomphorhynchus laevis]
MTTGPSGMELTINELQEMSVRQQHQIDVNNQIIKAREERLKHLLYQYKNDKLSESFNGQCKINPDLNRLRNLRKAINEYKLCKDCDVSDLEVLSMMCADKEEEIKSVSKRIDELNKQIEHFRIVKLQIGNSNDQTQDDSNNQSDEHDRLRQELLIRNRLNEQQSKKIAASKDLYTQKQKELLAIDARLLQLTDRLCSQKFVPPKFTDVAFINTTDDFIHNSSFSVKCSDSNAIQKSPKMSFSSSNQNQHTMSNEVPYCAASESSPQCFSVQNLCIDNDKINMHFNLMNSIKKRHSITESESSNYAQIPISQLRVKAEINEQKLSAAKSDSPGLTDNVVINHEVHCDVANDDTILHNTSSLKKVRFDPIAILLDAAVEGELDLVIQASKQLKDPSQPNDEGITALHNAVCAGNFHCVEYLVKCGCDINFADNDGWTPLHCAASCNNLTMISFLVEHGASIFAQTGNDSEIPQEKCEIDEEGYDECYEYLADVREKLGTHNDGLVYALYDHKPDNPDELEIKVNQKLKILRKGDSHESEWWWAEDIETGSLGYSPRNYLGLYPRVPPIQITE